MTGTEGLINTPTELHDDKLALLSRIHELESRLSYAPADSVITLIAWVVRHAEDLATVVGNDPDLLRDMAIAAKRRHDGDSIKLKRISACVAERLPLNAHLRAEAVDMIADTLQPARSARGAR